MSTHHEMFAIAKQRQFDLEADAAACRLASEAKKAKRAKAAHEASEVEPRRSRLFARPRPA